MDDMCVRATYTITTTVSLIITVAATLELKIIVIPNLDVFCVKILQDFYCNTKAPLIKISKCSAFLGEQCRHNMDTFCEIARFLTLNPSELTSWFHPNQPSFIISVSQGRACLNTHSCDNITANATQSDYFTYSGLSTLSGQDSSATYGEF